MERGSPVSSGSVKSSFLAKEKESSAAKVTEKESETKNGNLPKKESETSKNENLPKKESETKNGNLPKKDPLPKKYMNQGGESVKLRPTVQAKVDTWRRKKDLGPKRAVPLFTDPKHVYDTGRYRREVLQEIEEVMLMQPTIQEALNLYWLLLGCTADVKKPPCETMTAAEKNRVTSLMMDRDV